MAVSKIGNLVRLFESTATGVEDWSALEWFLVIRQESEGAWKVRRATGTEHIVPDSTIGKEYNFREFELTSAEELAEHLVLLNLKMDITNVPIAPSPSEQQMQTWAKMAAAAAASGTTTTWTTTTSPYSIGVGPIPSSGAPSIWSKITGK